MTAEERMLLNICLHNKNVFTDKNDMISDFVFKHMSEERENILNWYPFTEGCNVLLFDEEYGEILSAFKGKVDRVYAVYYDDSNYEIAHARCKLNNVSLERLEDFKKCSITRYDYIVINGIELMEEKFKKSFSKMLSYLGEYLTSNGRILLIGSNKDSIRDLIEIDLNNEKGHIYSKKDLVGLIGSTDYVLNKTYYPYPDRFFPTEIFTDETINSKNYGRQSVNYRSGIIYNDTVDINTNLLKDNGQMGTYADSFILEITNKQLENKKDIEYIKISTDRFEPYKIYTEIYSENGKKYVRKVPISKEAQDHLARVAVLESHIEGVEFLKGELQNGSIKYPFLSFPSMDGFFQEALNVKDYEKCRKILDTVFERLLSDSRLVNYRTDYFIEIFGKSKANEELESVYNPDIDIILDNIFVGQEKLIVIDPEWTLDLYIPVKYIQWRVIHECYTRYPQLEKGLSQNEIMNFYGISSELQNTFFEWEVHFTTEYIGAGRMRMYSKGYKDTLSGLIARNYGVSEYTSTLYTGMNVNIERSYVKDSIKKDGYYQFLFELEKEVHNITLRWDPCEMPCVCENIECLVDGTPVAIKPYNPIARIDGIDYFETDDPVYTIDMTNVSGKNICINVNIGPFNSMRWKEIVEEERRNTDKERKEKTELYNDLTIIWNSKLWDLYRMKHLIIKVGVKVKAILRKIKHRVLRTIRNYRDKDEHEILKLLESKLNLEYESPVIEETIDVIVPIYNGYDYLVKLFPSLLKTKVKTRIFLVDDKSPDERVHQIEEEFANAHDNVFVMNNEQNYGFVKSVNNALVKTTNHVALVNTDTELPEYWLERLMWPIINDETIASTTPYTNSGTIFSFPNMGYNNDIYRGMSVDEINEFFKLVKPVNAVAPTGVGFCMGMNRKTLDEIGALDYETFSKGFGEENDWCQRAVKKGYKNVQVENLFVYHKHGGSFQSKEKEELIAHNVAIVNKRYPNYGKDVHKYMVKDSNREIRELAQINLDMRDPKTKSILTFDHNWGGGATAYLNDKVKRSVEAGNAVTIVRYDLRTNAYYFYYRSTKFEKDYYFAAFSELKDVVKYLHYDEIIINEFATYPLLKNIMDDVKEMKNTTGAKMTFLAHDYFSVCPSITLSGTNQEYCGLPSGETCDKCFVAGDYVKNFQCNNVREWRKQWADFFGCCDEIRCFSEDTEKRLKKVFGAELPYTLVPHKVEYVIPLEKKYKTTDTFNIGVLGQLAVHKGSNIVKGMLEELRDEGNHDVKIIAIGETEDKSLLNYSNFEATGKYKPEDIVQLTLEKDIDVYLIPSVWPETFSYTTEEIIKMNMPVACFDLGAPAERVKKYEKGIIIPEMSSKVALESVLAEKKNYMLPKRTSKKVVYVVEFKSFSSRYRIEHMKEELLAEGIDGEIWYTDNLPKNVNWDEISNAVIYRCRYLAPVTGLVSEFKNHNIPIAYDIDDLIFEYENIKDLPFMNDPEYKDFEVYSADIDKCIEKCDVLITSTDTLKDELTKKYTGKPVIVNRNRASSSMAMLSLKARLQKNTYKEDIVMGYFSGSHTHNGDFDIISDVVLDVLKANPKIKLLIVGCLVLDNKFDCVSEQIVRHGFVDWRELPALIASCDINLMPLENTVFHWSKSENKWMEAGFVEVPTIASYNPEIANNTKDGENIVLCKSKHDWIRSIARMLDDKEHRTQIARNAYKYVYSHKITINIDGLWEELKD